MNTEQLLLNKWRTLTPFKQQEVLDFIDSLTPQSSQTEWQYLEQRPHPWRKQLYLKGICTYSVQTPLLAVEVGLCQGQSFVRLERNGK